MSSISDKNRNPQTTLLTASHIHVTLQKKPVVTDVSFSLREGDWLMIAGPNGAGKTTLVRALTQVLPYTGQVLYGQTDAKKLSGKRIGRYLGVLMQNGITQTGFTIEETVALGRYAHRRSLFSSLTEEDKRCIREAIALTGLNGMEQRTLNTCSGGELQRVFFSQLIAQQPQVLVLDEPTNHLDLPYQQQLFTWVDRWRQEPNHAVLTVVHDLRMARRYGTQALLLKNGKTVTQGAPAQALSDEALCEAYGTDIAAWERELAALWL